ncbi:type II toxin-antitoxin system VapC family toxin [Anaerolineales bacterium HSG6]|nr:type II toxin-antitoxin system VapC family toxin [Anaerolineales bacterium HSG6]MDM8531161.1 type II toxin-antitoxin system VapC family toxin [Anaerolineales bacterium HSG25]
MRHLDTNIVIAYLNGNQSVAEQLKNYLPDVAISMPVWAELRYGARASVKATENLQKLDYLLQVIDLVDFDRTCADQYSHIRLALRKKGRPTGEMDLLIASIAMAHEAILVTHNTKHFQHIDNLILEDWLA